MTDPYQILGVSRNASDDEIKKAYRNLSRKYHPDANINNPDKDFAEAKFKEIQQAYQQIIRDKESGSSSSSYEVLMNQKTPSEASEASGAVPLEAVPTAGPALPPQTMKRICIFAPPPITLTACTTEKR